MFLSAQPAEHA